MKTDELFRSKLLNLQVPAPEVWDNINQKLKPMGHILNLTLYVVQEEVLGVPREPAIFQRHADADQYYLQQVRTQYAYKLKKKDLHSFREAQDYFLAQGDEKYFIRFWTLEAK